MNIDEIIEQLLAIKQKYPTLTNDEILKIFELHLIARGQNR